MSASLGASVDISEPAAVASAVVPLEGNSLMLSLIGAPELLLSMLYYLDAKSLARLRATAHVITDEVRASLPLILRERSQPLDISLRTLHRVEHAIFHESFFSSQAFWQRWQRGPSRPPDDRASYRELDVGRDDDDEGSTFLRLHGGWRMNFSGAVHEFHTPVRPKRISFRVKLQTSCPSRSFFNVFFSSAADRYADEAVFYAGNPFHPPEPHDVFTFLVDASASTPEGLAATATDDNSMLWLPSGATMGVGMRQGQWHEVEMRLDWKTCMVRVFVDGFLRSQRGPLPFMAHRHLVSRHRALVHGGEPEERANEREALEAEIASIVNGFRRMFLFTWLDDPVAKETPEVRISDLWLEETDDVLDRESGQPMTTFDGALRRMQAYEATLAALHTIPADDSDDEAESSSSSSNEEEESMEEEEPVGMDVVNEDGDGA